MKLEDIRRANARALIAAQGGVTKVSKKLGHTSASFLSQQTGPTPSRDVTEKTVRQLEEAYRLPKGALDVEDATVTKGSPSHQNAPHGPITPELVAEVIHLVGTVLQSEGVEGLAPTKFASLVALAFADSMEHDGAAREGHIRSVVRLLKP